MLSPAITSVLSTGRRWRGSCFGVGLVAIGLALVSCASADSALGPTNERAELAVAPAVESPLDTTEPEPVVAVESAPKEDVISSSPAVPIQSGASLEAVQRERRTESAQAQPVRITVAALDIDASIRPVGVEADGEMEIPGATEVGWYRYGSRPGDNGSAVLAAHVDFNGEVGVFFDLGKADAGDIVDITYSDESVRSFVVTERSQYEKQSLPFDEIFRREGDPSLVLITCGGDFNPSLRSYEDNVVLFAEPMQAETDG